MPLSEQIYLQVALEDPERHWELDCGRLRRKPGMTAAHNQVAWILGFRLQSQLPLDSFVVRVDAGRTRLSASQYYIPDVMVIPYPLVRRSMLETPLALEAYSDPLPLIVEVWSPSTGEYDVSSKLPEYQRRGDLEIWLVRPQDRSIVSWRRAADGSYLETVYRGGMVQPVALPNVTIDLDDLFRG